MLVPLILTCFASPGQVPESQALLEAARNGSGVKSLLEKGLSPGVKDERGQTPLHLAAAHGHQATAEALLARGADINAGDATGKTPLDLADAAGHSGMVEFLRGRGARATIGNAAVLRGSGRPLKPSLKFKTIADFEREIGEPAVLLDSTNLCFFAPKRLANEARIVCAYLVKAYDALYAIVGEHTTYKLAIYAFPKGNTNAWGGTSLCSIDYDDSNLQLSQQPEWIRHHVPHVSGYIEEMAHNFVDATKAQFGWEMIGWSLGVEVSQAVAGNPVLAAAVTQTRAEQKRTFAAYLSNGHRFPADLPSNQCDRIHAWLLHECRNQYGPSFWKDFFRQIRVRKQELHDAAMLGSSDTIRNARYQITIDCFDQLPPLRFKQLLDENGISLTTDVKSLHPESPTWDRRFTN